MREAGWGRDPETMANAAARALRKRLTPQEVKLWVRLRELRLSHNLHFRRQAPIGSYVVDFENRRARIVIEIDGGQHAMPEGTLADAQRDAALTAKGYRVLRFWNSDVDSNLDGDVETILAACHPTRLAALATLP